MLRKNVPEETKKFSAGLYQVVCYCTKKSLFSHFF